MKVFLLNSLVVHELVSMHLEGQWLTAEQFAESATLWISRHAPDIQLSEKTIAELRLAAIQIAKDLMNDVQESPLTCLFLEIPDVNYANPLSTKAFSASLNVCREKLCGYGLSRGEKKGSGKDAVLDGRTELRPCAASACLRSKDALQLRARQLRARQLRRTGRTAYA
ncbi:hypothetical protein H3V53_19330 [Paraburkholderia bengalensis]|uniref:BACK domain-containing protein n=1 Tax=Paraburkholderia bengalensis TaxID=2747562 RepID=A0ABU8IV38_9BURK